VGVTPEVTPEEALELIRQGEGQRVEFKQSFSEDNEAIQSLCAFANADGGTVIFGVSPNGAIQGTSLGSKTLEDFGNKVRAHSDPPLAPSIDRLTVHGREVVAVALPKHAPGQLFYAFGKPHIRVGATNQTMTPDECRARLLEDQQRRPDETNRPRFATAPPLAGPTGRGVDPLALGQEIARSPDPARLRSIVRQTRMFFTKEWPSRIEEMSLQPVERTRIPLDEVYAYCLRYVESFAADIQMVEAFGLALADGEYA